jgi:hypothetical protein
LDRDVEVHAMAARPEKDVKDGAGLVVEFRGLDVKWQA